MFGLLVLICPTDFYIECGSIKDLSESKMDNTQVFDEMLYQIKSFFIQRNFDGKSLFRVLSKQAHSA